MHVPDDFWKNLEFRKIPRKTSSVEILLSHLGCPVCVTFMQFELSNLPPIATLKTNSAANVSCAVPRIFKIAGKASVLELL